MSCQKIEIFESQGKYYVLDGIKYDIHFPLAWAVDHKQDTGPKVCGNCSSYGKINNVFVCYCANCYMMYEGRRGGQVMVADHLDEESLWDELFYLRGVSKSKIGLSDSDNSDYLIESWAGPEEENNVLEEQQKLIKCYRTDRLMTIEKAKKRLEELKYSSETFYNDYSRLGRRERLDGADIQEEIEYLEDKILRY